MLLLALPCHSPNLAHFLLGYELLKPVSQTKLQDAGKLAVLQYTPLL